VSSVRKGERDYIWLEGFLEKVSFESGEEQQKVMHSESGDDDDDDELV